MPTSTMPARACASSRRPAGNPPRPGMPQTGDAATWIPLACLAGAAVCAVAVGTLGCRKQRKGERDEAPVEEGEEG